MASRKSKDTEKSAEREQRRSVESDAIESWYIAVALLGAGAERLEADTKRKFVDRIIRLSAIILEDWTRESADVNYSEIRDKLCNDEQAITDIAKSDSEADIAEAKRTLSALVDVLEYALVSQPFRTIVNTICEEARDKVLAESVINTNVDGTLERLIRNIWLADLDSSVGVKGLIETIKSLPNARFLRITLAAHLISRVFWRHSDKTNRLSLLGVAQQSLKIAGLQYDKDKLQRLIERESD